MVPDKFALVAGVAMVNSYHGKYGAVNTGMFTKQSAFNIGHTDGLICEYGNLLIICFRGSNGKSDWVDNFTFDPIVFGDKKIKVHRGFVKQYLAVKKMIDSAVLLKKKIVVCGHSLGGAIATIVAYKIAMANPRKIVMCVTWGSPRVGNAAFVKDFKKFVSGSMRFVNANDIVCRVPFSWIFKYRHVSDKIKIGSKRISFKYIFEKIFGSTDDHRPDKYMTALRIWRGKLI